MVSRSGLRRPGPLGTLLALLALCFAGCDGGGSAGGDPGLVQVVCTTGQVDIDLVVPEGKLVGIIGPNGAGKSTLFKAALGLVPLVSGKVEHYLGAGLQERVAAELSDAETDPHGREIPP